MSRHFTIYCFFLVASSFVSVPGASGNEMETWGMPFTQCKVLYVGNYLNPSFGPFTSLLFRNGVFFQASCALRMWHI